MDRRDWERKDLDSMGAREMGKDRGRDKDQTKEQILSSFGGSVLEELNDLGTNLEEVVDFWSAYVQYRREGHTSMESLLKMRMLPRYQENRGVFDYFCYIGLISFTEKLISDVIKERI